MGKRIKVTVASVPHTGSHFVVDLIGYECRTHSRCGEPIQNLWHVYPGESLKTITEWVSGGAVLVVPLKHPMKTAQSWANRGKPIAEDPVHHPMISLWRNLIDIVDKLKPFYLPVDTHDRERYLERLAERLGKRMKTQWEPVGHHPGNEKLSDSDRKAVEDLMTDPFFARFGYGR